MSIIKVAKDIHYFPEGFKDPFYAKGDGSRPYELGVKEDTVSAMREMYPEVQKARGRQGAAIGSAVGAGLGGIGGALLGGKNPKRIAAATLGGAAIGGLGGRQAGRGRSFDSLMQKERDSHLKKLDSFNERMGF